MKIENRELHRVKEAEKKAVKSKLPKPLMNSAATIRHFTAPDKYPPPPPCDLESLMMKNQIFTGNAYYEYNFDSVQFDSDANTIITALSPVTNYAFAQATDVTTTVGSVKYVSDGNWSASNYNTHMGTTFTHYRILGVKYEAIITTPALDRGGRHGFFPIRPGVDPLTALGTTDSPMFTIQKYAPLHQTFSVTQDISATWFNTFDEAYDWIAVDTTEVPFSYSPKVETLFRDQSSGAPSTLGVPYYMYVYEGPTPGNVLIKQYVYYDCVQVPGLLPPAIVSYNDRVNKYRELTLDKSTTTKMLASMDIPMMPTVNTVLKEVRNNNGKRDMKWFDKIAYALNGKDLVGTVKDIGKSLVSSIPTLIASFL